ncbi:MAG: hypothetical protein ACRD6W_17455, partial [Nitrososphaerales archaeon]
MEIAGAGIPTGATVTSIGKNALTIGPSPATSANSNDALTLVSPGLPGYNDGPNFIGGPTYPASTQSTNDTYPSFSSMCSYETGLGASAESFGTWGPETHTYASLADVPASICINLYDVHNAPQYNSSGAQRNNDYIVDRNDDNSIQQNSFQASGPSCVQTTNFVTQCSPVGTFSSQNVSSPTSRAKTGKENPTRVVYAKSGSVSLTSNGSALSLTGPSGPQVTGAKATVTATLTCMGEPAPKEPITFSVSGSNPTTGSGVTDANGQATFTYTGHNNGLDTVSAAFTSGGNNVESNQFLISWVTPIEPVSTTGVTGRFYYGGCGYVCANVTEPPLFTEDFPTIDFNPPGGTIPGNITGVNPSTRPLTDVTTNAIGDFTGTVVAEGDNSQGTLEQAGVNDMFQFDAVFTADYVVTSAGDVTFNFYDDDGFVLGIGDGVTRVSGADVNPPAATELERFPVMGGFNDPTSPAGNSVTVDFPAPGTYPYEVDYSECCGGTLALTMATASGVGVPPAGNLTITPANVPQQTVGQPVQLTVAAMGAAGGPITGLPLTMTVYGANAQVKTGTTNTSGLAVMSYTGDNAGDDTVVVGASVSGQPAVSNTVAVTWAFGSGSSASEPPPIISDVSPVDGTVVTKPVAVTAGLNCPTGQTVSSWTVAYQGSNVASPTTLSSGSGSPPSVLGTFDPTNLPNGTYTVTISATCSGGGSQTASTSVAVYGGLKLGPYVTTYQDLSVQVGGFQMAVDRTYNSSDKSDGDFGVGWHVSLSDFKVSSNRELGAGGWTEYPTSCIFGLCDWAFKTSTPHYVTVTWPDGHDEVFDFTPTGGEALLYDEGAAAYTPAPGTDTTSTLLPMPGDENVSYGFDGNIYNGSGGIYNPTEFELVARDGTTYVLSTATGLVSETDPDGNSLTVDSSGVTASDGQSLIYTRDSDGRITKITGPSGQTLTYTYSAAGDLASSTDPDGRTTTYSYDSDHDLLGAVGPDGHALQTLHYNSAGRLTAVTDADGNTTEINDDVAGQQQTFTDPNGKLTTVSTYDNLGDIVEQDQIVGSSVLTTKFTYDSDGRVTSETDPLGDTRSYSYDARGDMTGYKDPDGNHTSTSFNSLGEPTAVTGPGGTQLAAATYDSHGNPTSVSKGGKYTYQIADNSEGMPTSVTDPSGGVTKLAYDAEGHLVSMTDPAGATTTFEVDANGDVDQVTNALGHTTKYGYDQDGALTSVIDANGATSTIKRDSLGRVDSETDALGQTTTFSYDSNGNLTSVRYSDGRTVSYQYDSDGKLTSETAPDGTTNTFTYDALSRLTSAQNATSAVSMAYNGADELVSQKTTGTDQPTESLDYAYDSAGNRISMTGPDGTTDYAYGPLGQLSTETDPAGGVFKFTYNAADELTSLDRPNDVDTTIGYDADGNLARIESLLGSEPVQDLSYSYDADGQRVSQTNSSGTTTYGYDSVGQLTSVKPPSGSALGYGYDADGNPMATPADPLGSLTYNADDELVSGPDENYSYDASGDLVKSSDTANGSTVSYTWSVPGQLTSVATSGGSHWSASYDPLGRQVTTTNASGTTANLYDGENLVGQFLPGTAEPQSYVQGPAMNDPLELVQPTGQSDYYLSDASG